MCVGRTATILNLPPKVHGDFLGVSPRLGTCCFTALQVLGAKFSI